VRTVSSILVLFLLLLLGGCEKAPKEEVHSKEQAYTPIKSTIILLATDWQNDTEVNSRLDNLIKEFRRRKAENPKLYLKIYGHIDPRTRHEFSPEEGLGYAEAMKKLLLQKGLDKDDIRPFFYRGEESSPDLKVEELQKKVSFSVEE